MPLTQIIASSPSSTITLVLEDPSDGYSVQDVKGLGPVRATLVSSAYAQRNGSYPQASRREERFITIRLGFEEGWNGLSVEELRMNLYNHFMPQTELRLALTTSTIPEVWINGIVESCEPDIFSDDPAVDIAITCNDPDFFNPLAEIVTGVSTATTDETDLLYSGTLETGFRFVLSADREVDNFSLYLRGPNGVLRQMDFVGLLHTGDTLTISTIPGLKGVYLNGTVSNLTYLTPQSPWLELRPGLNKIRVYSDGAPLAYALEYTNKYGGL